MSFPVSLREVIEEIDVPVRGTAYLSRKTGKVLFLPDDDLGLDDEDLAGDDAEELRELKEGTSSENYVEFSLHEELDEYGLMARFAAAVENAQLAARLDRALQGRGAFRRFKDVAGDHGLLDQWYEYRDRALEEEVARWLDENGIAYTRP